MGHTLTTMDRQIMHNKPLNTYFVNKINKMDKIFQRTYYDPASKKFKNQYEKQQRRLHTESGQGLSYNYFDQCYELFPLQWTKMTFEQMKLQNVKIYIQGLQSPLQVLIKIINGIRGTKIRTFGSFHDKSPTQFTSNFQFNRLQFKVIAPKKMALFQYQYAYLAFYVQEMLEVKIKVIFGKARKL